MAFFEKLTQIWEQEEIGWNLVEMGMEDDDDDDDDGSPLPFLYPLPIKCLSHFSCIYFSFSLKDIKI